MVVYLAITAHELYSYTRHRARPKGVSEPDVEANAEQTELAQKKPGQDKELPELPQVVVTQASYPPSVDGHGISHSRGEGSTGASSIRSSYSHGSPNANARAVYTPVSLSSPPPTPSPTFGNNGRQRRPRRRSQANVDPMFLGIIISSTFLAYFISTTELLIAKNPADNTNQWAFGQILAMVLVVPSFISVVQAIQERGFERIHHRLTKKFTRARHRASTQRLLYD
ncbi:hypothetical protein EIP86_004474 [Pleurotus ostreatoroseus]|nr:hypothetical protein EIP86_004474 [Pleurotus ostreatoroseus]